MNRNVLYIVIAILVVIVAVLGWKYYQDTHTAKLEIKMDDNGLSVQTN